MSGQQQHVEFYRKALLRRHLLRWAVDGAVYVPFIGDGDLAVDLYSDRKVFGADIDPSRVMTARKRLVGADIELFDCDLWPFPGLETPIAVADFDAYVEPYRSFRSFWKGPNVKADRLVMFFTDGWKESFTRNGHWTKPDGTKVTLAVGHEKHRVFNSYLTKQIWPWFEDFIEGWRVLDRWRYQRSRMTYWGAAIERVQ
jgi:hypothetical protein